MKKLNVLLFDIKTDRQLLAMILTLRAPIEDKELKARYKKVEMLLSRNEDLVVGREYFTCYWEYDGFVESIASYPKTKGVSDV